MIVRQRDYYRDRMGAKELLDPFIPHKSGASEDIVFKEDVFQPEKSYADPGFEENIWEREAIQLIPFEAGLRRIAGANENKNTIWDDIWDWITGNIWDFLSGGKAGVDPKVLQAIQKVEAECGLTEDVKWAYAWYDKRYPLPLGNTWKGYVYYASQWALFPWDKQHYINCATHCLNQLQNYLQSALSKAAGKPIGGIMDFLKKYGAYLAMGSAGLALILVLATRGRAPVYIVPERR